MDKLINEVVKMNSKLDYKLWLDKLYSVDLSVEVLDLIIDEGITISEAIKKIASKMELDERYVESFIPEMLVA